MNPQLRDWREERDWARPWRDKPGLICCCGGGAAAQVYHVFAGVKFGSPAVRQSTNYKWDSGAWASMAAAPSARDSLAASTPANPGSAYIYGGISNSAFLSETDGYAPDAWTTETAMPTVAQRATGMAVGGFSYSVGGENSSNLQQTYNYKYDPVGNSWATKATLTAARANACGSYIGSKLYNICGDSTVPTQTQNTYEYDPSGDSWATKSNFPSNEDGQNAWTLGGTIYANLGNPGGKIQKTYIVDTWGAGTNPTTAASSVWAAGASIDTASNVGYFTGGNLTGTTSSTQHFEFSPTVWTSRTAIPTAIQNAGAAIA